MYAKPNNLGSLNPFACTDNVISVGSYNTRIDYTIMCGDTYCRPDITELNGISSFSSYCTSHYGKAKPDVVAPGGNIISVLPILYEDNEIIVINKPSGLLSVASDTEKGRTAYRMVNDYVQQKDKHNRIFVVHRLDEDTSGVLMFAKNPKIRDIMQKEWNDIVLARGYYAVVEGRMEKPQDKFIDYLKENSLNLMYVSNDRTNGKKCITSYKVIKSNKNYSLLDVDIETGRKNQIRVQLGHRGHYVVGDDKYGEPSNPLNRLGLHAYKLKLIHPITKKLLEFVAPIPQEFEKLFK